MGELYQAARATDPIGHGWGMVGVIGGALFGAALVVAGAATGGLAIAALIAVCVLSGATLAHGLQRVLADGKSFETGVLGFGSPNVRINGLGAARVLLDFANPICNGLYGANHSPILPFQPIAEGSSTVKINGQCAGRVSSRLMCAADIMNGSPNVWIGGETEHVLWVIDIESIITTTAGLFLLIIAPEAAIIGYFLTKEIGDWADEQFGPGWGDIINGTLGFLAVGLGAVMSRRGVPEDLISRRDNYASSSEGRNPGSRKSYIDEEGNLNPANKDGSATATQHVRGSEPAKSDSPYTSFSEEGTGNPKNYGDKEITVDRGRLSRDIESGKVKDVEIIENKDLLRIHDETIAKAQERYNANQTPKNLERLNRAQMDKQNSIRDNEVLIKGVVPKKYIKTKP